MTDVTEVLDRAEASVNAGRGLRGTGFWKMVDALRADPDAAAGHAERVAAIDRRAFESGVKLRVPAWFGVLAFLGASLVGAALVVVSLRTDGALAIVAFLAGMVALLGSTHTLAHVVVGVLVGIRFTHFFLGPGPKPPRPGTKIDYASFLRVRARRRAVMFASGAVVTKIVPFALIPWAPSDAVRWVLIAIGILQIVTDVTISTKSSDWKKAIREWRAASGSR